MADIKLCYFDARGFAEVSRLVLALADQKYEDIRCTPEEWPKHKSVAPFGQGPFLVYNDKKIGQSAAIACFLAREFGLFGKSNLEAAVIEQVIYIYKDFVAAVMKAMSGEQDEEKKKAAFEKLKEDEIPKFLGHFVQLLKENGSKGFFVENAITVADLYVYDLLFGLKKTRDYDACAQYPELKTLYDKVGENPKIKNYVANRRDTLH